MHMYFISKDTDQIAFFLKIVLDYETQITSSAYGYDLLNAFYVAKTFSGFRYGNRGY